MRDFNNDPNHHEVVQWLLVKTDLIVQITGGNYRLRTLGHSSSMGEKKSDSTLMQEQTPAECGDPTCNPTVNRQRQKYGP